MVWVGVRLPVHLLPASPAPVGVSMFLWMHAACCTEGMPRQGLAGSLLTQGWWGGDAKVGEQGWSLRAGLAGAASASP